MKLDTQIKIIRQYTKIINKIYLRCKPLGDALYSIKHHTIEKIIENRYFDSFKFYHEENTGISNDLPIWVIWFQGMQNAPDLVKSCYEYLKMNSNGRKVNLITLENYKDYIDMPEELIDRAKKGTVRWAHISDLIRCKLLYSYGGIYIDATVLVTQPIPLDICKYDFFTIKHIRQGLIDREISQGYWRIFFMCATPRLDCFRISSEILERHIIETKNIIDYFTMDYIMHLCYLKDEKTKKMFDNVPYNNNRVYDLVTVLEKEYDVDYWKNLCTENWLHKLTVWRTFEIGKKTFMMKLFNKDLHPINKK